MGSSEVPKRAAPRPPGTLGISSSTAADCWLSAGKVESGSGDLTSSLSSSSSPASTAAFLAISDVLTAAARGSSEAISRLIPLSTVAALTSSLLKIPLNPSSLTGLLCKGLSSTTSGGGVGGSGSSTKATCSSFTAASSTIGGGGGGSDSSSTFGLVSFSSFLAFWSVIIWECSDFVTLVIGGGEGSGGSTEGCCGDGCTCVEAGGGGGGGELVEGSPNGLLLLLACGILEVTSGWAVLSAMTWVYWPNWPWNCCWCWAGGTCCCWGGCAGGAPNVWGTAAGAALNPPPKAAKGFAATSVICGLAIIGAGFGW